MRFFGNLILVALLFAVASCSDGLPFGMTYGGGIVFINSGGIVKSRVPKGISAQRLEDELKKIL